MTAALIHASRAALDPVSRYYAANEPGWTLVNLLDDGVMRRLDGRDTEGAERRLASMVSTAHQEYGAQSALITCSALSARGMGAIRAAAPVPVVKIDEPMARAAVLEGRRIGVLATFPATVETTRELLETAAGVPLEIQVELAAEALRALLDGGEAAHDAIFFQALDRLAAWRPDAIVLAQVSMARLHEAARRRAGVPVFSSLASSLDAMRAIMRRA